MNLNLDNKVFIISGSSRGIGKGVARVLLREEARVMLTGRDAGSLAETYEEFQSEFPGRVLQCGGDLNVVEVLNEIEQATLERWSRIDGVIANAGAVKPVSGWDMADSDWDWYFAANFQMGVRFVTHFVRQIKKTRGTIVIISSIAGLEDIGAPLPYSCSKAALTMYGKGLARKLAPDNIRVNTVAPGNIIFPGGNWDKKRKADSEAIQKMIEEKVPLKAFGSPEDIGNMVAFLVSEKARFVTGSCFVVDGGQSSLFI